MSLASKHTSICYTNYIMMMHLILLFFVHCQIVYSQTACQFFSSIGNNYTAWSESHIATWCKDHDPSSTSQCATVVWPPYIRYPGRVKFHRNMKEWFLQVNPKIGTRRDCIARSSALNINSTTHENGLSEAVTCELYYFDPERRNECVCYPIYRDYATKISTVVHNVYKVFETTSVFYPPGQVVESYLLAAATQGPPVVCNSRKSKCPKSVEVISREPRVLGGFPYCPTPGSQARQHLPARTLAPWKYDVTSSRTSTRKSSVKDWGSLPTAAECERNDTRPEKAQCKNDMCMWQFLQYCMSPEVKAVTALDSNGAFLFATSRTDYTTMSQPHWGSVADPASTTTPWPMRTTKGERETSPQPPRDTSVLSAESHFKELGMTEYITPRPTAKSGLVCHDEISCRKWCEVQGKRSFKRMMQLLAGGLGVAALAGLGMASRTWGKGLRRRWHKIHNGRHQNTENDAQESEFVPTNAGLVQGLELVRIPSAGRRGRGKVRFQGDGADGAVELSDGSINGLRRMSGHEPDA